MSSLVVWLSLLFGLGFTLAYVLIPRLKKEIEAPKYIFQKQLQRYDTQLGEQAFSKESRNEEK
jgi:uncharacterized membrane protein YciS (DUF1049 family)